MLENTAIGDISIGDADPTSLVALRVCAYTIDKHSLVCNRVKRARDNAVPGSRFLNTSLHHARKVRRCSAAPAATFYQCPCAHSAVPDQVHLRCLASTTSCQLYQRSHAFGLPRSFRRCPGAQPLQQLHHFVVQSRTHGELPAADLSHLIILFSFFVFPFLVLLILKCGLKSNKVSSGRKIK